MLISDLWFMIKRTSPCPELIPITIKAVRFLMKKAFLIALERLKYDYAKIKYLLIKFRKSKVVLINSFIALTL